MTNTKRDFFNRTEAEAFASECRANGTFVRWSEARVRVTNKVAPAAAQARPRMRFTVTFRAEA